MAAVAKRDAVLAPEATLVHKAPARTISKALRGRGTIVVINFQPTTVLAVAPSKTGKTSLKSQLDSVNE